MPAIPEFRLPKDIVAAEVGKLEEGGKFINNAVVGRTGTVDELLRKVLMHWREQEQVLPSFMGIPGENLLGVCSANEYLVN